MGATPAPPSLLFFGLSIMILETGFSLNQRKGNQKHEQSQRRREEHDRSFRSLKMLGRREFFLGVKCDATEFVDPF